MTDTLLLAFDDESALAHSLAAALGCALRFVAEHHFPDGETKLTLPAELPPRVVVLRGLHRPNHKLVALMLLSDTARSLGARELVLVAPYMAYMRQDIAFGPGEAISQRIVTNFLAERFDALVTIDPHLHRVATLDDLMPARRGVALTAAPLLGAWLAAHAAEVGGRPILAGPDEEASQWVRGAAAASGWPGVWCTKIRRGDRDVSVDLPAVDLRGRAVVLIDDLASTGHTLMQAARAVHAAGAGTVDAAIVHALFTDDAPARLRDAGIRHVWSTDAVVHASNAVPVAPLLAQALRGLALPSMRAER